MRLLKLALITELELGCIWTLILMGMPPGDEVAMAGILLFVPVYLVHLPCMIAGAIQLFRRPETRPLAAAVLTVPIALLFLPALVRVAAGGPVTVHPAVWLVIPGLPLASCLLLPHHVSEFLPRWTLRSRGLNLGTVVVLSSMVVPWAGLLLVAPATAHAAGGGSGGSGSSGSADLREALFDGPQAGFLLVVFAFAALSALIALITLLTSYVGLFQQEDRSQQKLRVAQLVLSIVVLVPALLVVAVGLVLVAIVATPLG